MNALVHAKLSEGETVSNEAGASSSRDPAAEDQSMKDGDEMDDESKTPKEGNESKKSQRRARTSCKGACVQTQILKRIMLLLLSLKDPY